MKDLRDLKDSTIHDVHRIGDEALWGYVHRPTIAIHSPLSSCSGSSRSTTLLQVGVFALFEWVCVTLMCKIGYV